jgi:hypothetical protein
MYFGLVCDLERDLLQARGVDPQMRFVTLEKTRQ